MRLTQVVRPKHPLNLVITAALALLSVLCYPVGLWWSGVWSPKRDLGLVFGILAALAFVFEMGYPLRRPKAFPLFTAKVWLQAHVYLGALAFVGVLVHCGFSWPHGKFGWLLWLLAAWTTLTGLLGVWLQKWIPAALAEGLRVEALYERIPELVTGLRDEADKLVADAGEALVGFYRREVRASLERTEPSWAFLLDVRAGQQRALEPLRRIAAFVEPEDRPKLDDLITIVTEKRELDAQRSLQWLLRVWLRLHVPFAGILMALLLVHIFTWLWY